MKTLKTPRRPVRTEARAAVTVRADGHYVVQVDADGRSVSYTVRAVSADVAARFALWRFRQRDVDPRNPWL